MSWLSTIKEVTELVQKADNIDLMRKLMDVEAEMMEMQQSNAMLQQRVSELEREKDLRDRLVYHEPAYYLKQADGTEDGPYCNACWEVEGRLARRSSRTGC